MNRYDEMLLPIHRWLARIDLASSGGCFWSRFHHRWHAFWNAWVLIFVRNSWTEGSWSFKTDVSISSNSIISVIQLILLVVDGELLHLAPWDRWVRAQEDFWHKKKHREKISKLQVDHSPSSDGVTKTSLSTLETLISSFYFLKMLVFEISSRF